MRIIPKRLAIAIRKALANKCNWENDSGEHSTSCGRTFYNATETGFPVTDWMWFCPFCAGEITLAPPIEAIPLLTPNA